MQQDFHLAIEGMHCDTCVRRATAALQQVPDVGVVAVMVGAATVRAGSDEAARRSMEALERAGM